MTTTTARKTAIVTLDLEDTTENWVEGTACHGCVMLVANGEINEDNTDWDLDTALKTQEEYTVTLGDDVDDFSTSTCIVCDSTLPGYRHEVTLFPR